LWLNDNRQKIKDGNPGISITEISKKAGEIWGKMTDKSVSLHCVDDLVKQNTL